MKSNNTGFRYDIAILRLLAIVVVVAFHGYGMTMVHFSESTNEVFRNTYYMFNQAGAINIAMPLFVWISGYLFYFELRMNNLTLKKLAIKKFKRIILPYIVFSMIFMLTTNSFSFEPFYRGGYWHLWFLPMLMWCFIVGRMFFPIVKGENRLAQIGIQAILFIIIFIPIKLPELFEMQKLKNWFCWFYLGMMSWRYEKVIINFFKYTHIALLLALICIVIMILYPTLYEDYTWYKILASFCGIFSLWYFFSLISWKNLFFTDFLLSLSGLSFGVYVFHNWMQMHMLSKTVQRLLPIESFASNHIYLFPVLLCILAYAFSAMLTYALRQTKIGRNFT